MGLTSTVIIECCSAEKDLEFCTSVSRLKVNGSFQYSTLAGILLPWVLSLTNKVLYALIKMFSPHQILFILVFSEVYQKEYGFYKQF